MKPDTDLTNVKGLLLLFTEQCRSGERIWKNAASNQSREEKFGSFLESSTRPETAASVLVMFDPAVQLREAVKAEVNTYVQRRKDPLKWWERNQLNFLQVCTPAVCVHYTLFYYCCCYLSLWLFNKCFDILKRINIFLQMHQCCQTPVLWR